MPRVSKRASKCRYFAKPELDNDVDLRIAMFAFIRTIEECTMKKIAVAFQHVNEKKRYKIVKEFCSRVVDNDPIVKRRGGKRGEKILYAPEFPAEYDDFPKPKKSKR